MLAADLVLDKKVDRACALRPGHHAMRIVHGSRGFVLSTMRQSWSSTSVTGWAPKQGVAIVDTDAHHADGTQDIFYNDPGVLHISIHQDGRTLYPGTGTSRSGEDLPPGQTVNIPCRRARAMRVCFM